MSGEHDVLFVDHAGVLGGAELSLLDLAAEFGVATEVLLLSDGPFRALLESRGVRVAVEPLGALARVRKDSSLPPMGALVDAANVSRRVARRAKRHGVIYANSQKAFVVSAAAGLLARRPVVWHLRDILAEPHFSRSNVFAATTLANFRAARVIANSQATADAFVAGGGNSALVRVVHNGIDAAPFDAVSDDDARNARAALGIPATAFVAALFGRFHSWKGQQVLLEALAALPGVHALFVGAALFGEEEFERSQHEQAKRLGVSDRTHFLGFRADIAPLMRASNAIVHASILPEPFGRVVVEGMLAGRPVVATRAGGVPEILTDGDTGLLVPPNNPAALALALRQLHENPALAREIAERGQRHAQQHFTVQAMVSGVKRALDDL